MRDVRSLVAIGRRPLGSENGRKAAAFIGERFRSLGFRVEEQSFSFPAGFKDKATRIIIVKGALSLKSARALTFSPSARLEAEAVALDSPLVDPDLGRLNLKGKIVLVPQGLITFDEKERRVTGAGAAALIVYNSEPGSFTGDLITRGTIPAISISGEDGRLLLDRLKKEKLRLCIESETVTEEGRGINVVATRPGSSDDVLAFGAHYDSVPEGVGANNNGSGVGVLLELARVMAGSGRKETLVFAAFDGEEAGLLGSKAYVDNLDAGHRHALRAALVFDTVASPGEGPYFLEGTDGLVERALEVGKQLDAPVSRHEGGSDEKSFLNAGIPTLLFHRHSGGLANTPHDTVERMRPEWLSTTGHFALALVDRL